MTHFEVAQNLPDGISVENVKLPERSTTCSAGYDFRAPKDFKIPAHGRLMIPTGVTCFLENNQYLAIVPRSGLALKSGITVLNTPGTVDADYYPNSIGVILFNTTDEDYEVKAGDKIAQGIISTYGITGDDEAINVREGGFGSTGR